MNILMICKSLPGTFKGGIQTHVWKISEWLVKLGHEVHILAGGSFKKKEQIEEIDGRIIHKIPFFPGRKLPVMPIFAEEYSFNQAAAKWLNKNASKFDIIHMQGRSGYLFDWKRKFKKVPIVITLHGLIDVEYAQSNKKVSTSIDRHWHQKRTKQFEAKQFERADAMISVSHEMHRLLGEQYPEFIKKSFVIYNGIDRPDFTPSPINLDSKTLLFVGRISSIKGLFPLMEAMQKVRKDIKLVILGNGPDRAALEQDIQEKQLQDNVILKGAVSMQEVFEWVDRSYALILPSFYETQGIVLMEGNICGRPVLASNINGINEVVEHGKNGILFEKGNPDEIAKSINWLFDHPEEAKKMGDFGETYIMEKFAWENIAKKTTELYSQLIAQKNNNTVEKLIRL